VSLPLELLFSLACLVASASAAPTAADSEEAALRRSLELRAQGDLQGAAAALSPRVDSQGRRIFCGPLLGPWCAFYRADALLWAGAPLEAAVDFRAARSLDPDGPVAHRALSLEGESLLAGALPAPAVPLLRQALKRRASPELSLNLGNALLSAGDERGAIAIWQRLYLERPAHRAAAIAAKKLAALSALDAFSTSELIARANGLLAASRTDKALKAAKAALKAARDPEETALAQLCLARVLSAAKRPEEAEASLEQAKKSSKAEVQLEVELLLARLAMARGQLDRAATLFAQIEAHRERQSEAEEAGFMHAWLPFNQGDWSRCAQSFRAFLGPFKSARRADEALWFAGLCSFLAGDKKEAAAAFEELERTSVKLAPQALYWRARCEGSSASAAELYNKLLRASPTSWYAWLARTRLSELKAAAEPFPFSAAPGGHQAAVDVRERRAEVLARLGLTRDAEGELEAIALRRASEAQSLRASQLSADLGLFGRSYRIANARLWASAFERREPIALGLLFPRPYEEPVKAAAKSVGLDPYFLWAIMRRESSFNPLALSPARAYGLMQLLASTARKIALVAGDQRPSLEGLQRPERALPLAAWYLSDLLGRFKHAALAAAGYNAGPRAVARWVTDRGARPLDEMVELIPFKETRLYVKAVLGDYFTYRALWGSKDEALPMPLKIPEVAAGASF
jgi:soluble lytic murein transglycosylase